MVAQGGSARSPAPVGRGTGGVMAELCADLAAEQQALDDILSAMPPSSWDLPTPAEGWAVRDQVSHLAWFDAAGLRALRYPEAFAAEAAEVVEGRGGGSDPMAEHLRRGREMSGSEVLAWWRRERVPLVEALARTDPKTRVPWYGVEMGARSFATARLMEVWAHGQDVVDAAGAVREPTDRLVHVAHMGVATMGFSHSLHGVEAPPGGVRVELQAPSGGLWAFGPEGAADRVLGPALDFALVVTQRRHVDDTALVAKGDGARRWLEIAQAFAGAPGGGRRPGQFVEGAPAGEAGR